MNNTLTDVPGILVGHAQDIEAATGCTVVICPEGATPGIDQRGGAPGSRETEMLRPMHRVEKIQAVFLSGGSAFGLDAAGGVMSYLEEQDIGHQTLAGKVPIVTSAIIFDLMLGSATVRPDAAMARAACQVASSEPVAQGNVGAGTGAAVGGIMGMDFRTKGGTGSASINLNGLLIAALVIVNAVGDIYDLDTQQIIAGARIPPEGVDFANTLDVFGSMAQGIGPPQQSNTVIGVVATNADLTKEETNKVAQMASNGLARVIRPANTMFDGDTIFALSTGERKADVNVVGAYAAQVMSQAIMNGIWAAEPLHGLPSASTLAGKA